MKIFVEDYYEHADYHRCRDEQGQVLYLDLVTNGDFFDGTENLQGEAYINFVNGLVGRTFEVEELYPWIYFACGLRELK